MILVRSPATRYRWREVAEAPWNAGLHREADGIGVRLEIAVRSEKEVFRLQLTGYEAHKLAAYITEHSDGTDLIFLKGGV